VKRLLIGLVIVAVFLLFISVSCGQASNCEQKLHEAELHLELVVVAQESTGPEDIASAIAAERILKELDNETLLDAFYAYEYCPEEQAAYYWERFCDTWTAEIKRYLATNNVEEK